MSDFNASGVRKEISFVSQISRFRCEMCVTTPEAKDLMKTLTENEWESEMCLISTWVERPLSREEAKTPKDALKDKNLVQRLDETEIEIWSSSALLHLKKNGES